MSVSTGQSATPGAVAFDPFDPVALEARLTEARARRAVALARKSAAPIHAETPAAAEPAPAELPAAAGPAPAELPDVVEPTPAVEVSPPAPAVTPSRRGRLLPTLILAGVAALAGMTALLMTVPAGTPPDALLTIAQPAAPAGPALAAAQPAARLDWAVPAPAAVLVPPTWPSTGPRLTHRLAGLPPPRPAAFTIGSVRSAGPARLAASPRSAADFARPLSTILRSIGQALDGATPATRSPARAFVVRSGGRIAPRPSDDGPALSAGSNRGASVARSPGSKGAGAKPAPDRRETAASPGKADRADRGNGGRGNADRADRGNSGRGNADRADRGNSGHGKSDRADRGNGGSGKGDRSGRGDRGSGKSGRGDGGHGRSGRGGHDD